MDLSGTDVAGLGVVGRERVVPMPETSDAGGGEGPSGAGGGHWGGTHAFAVRCAAAPSLTRLVTPATARMRSVPRIASLCGRYSKRSSKIRSTRAVRSVERTTLIDEPPALLTRPSARNQNDWPGVACNPLASQASPTRCIVPAGT